MKKYSALGVMSGSSLDGVDLALCSFTESQGRWSYHILKAETVSYTDEWQRRLSEIPSAAAQDLVKYDIQYGQYLGALCSGFLNKHQLSVDLIASHGHTIFHNPEENYTFQLGSGQALAKETGIKTICDFRTKNVLLGGQGAPLVPIGDELLFGDMDYCLNLGGIANISFREKDQRRAFDICPSNQLLNYLSSQLGQPYDKNGNLARKGQLVAGLYEEMDKNPYYIRKIPKSLGNEYVRNSFLSLFTKYPAPTEDLLHTSVKHIAYQIAQVFKTQEDQKVLVTGGGAHNKFLMEVLQEFSPQEFIVPNQKLTDFKEAMIFAFMGILRDTGQVNCLASYTGAKRDLSTGTIFLP